VGFFGQSRNSIIIRHLSLTLREQTFVQSLPISPECPALFLHSETAIHTLPILSASAMIPASSWLVMIKIRNGIHNHKGHVVLNVYLHVNNPDFPYSLRNDRPEILRLMYFFIFSL